MTTAGEFRRRARFEADRYAGDAWVFVRELLQNARDAGARRVDLIAERRNGRDRIVCRDDGDGMSFEHARRFLFTLYASSKGGHAEAAGRFGIGFWSVLRFRPDRVIVRSTPQEGRPWEVRLSGDLERVQHRDGTLDIGTEVELQRPAGGDDPADAVWEAVRRDARYLRRRDADEDALEVRVNSRLATHELALPPPSLAFDRPGVRGVVALGEQPRVDLLAHGLRVRTAATLDELLMEPDRRRTPVPSIPDGLVPRVVLDSRRLQVLMARGDARTDAELRRLVGLGRSSVRRLVKTELDRAAGLGRAGRLAMRVLELSSMRWVRRACALTAMVGLVAAAAALVTVIIGKPVLAPLRLDAGPRVSADPLPETVLGAGLEERYGGPAVDAMDRHPSRVALVYRPATARPMLAAFRVTGMDDDGRPISATDESASRPYLGGSCGDACLELELQLDVPAGRVRLPVPTGHLLDPSSLRTGGAVASLWAAADGAPVLELGSDYRGRVGYRSGLAVEPGVGLSPRWPALPLELDSLARSIRGSAPDRAALLASDWVRRRIVYDTSASTVDRHRDAAESGSSFFERCLEIGAGDCDVQNALLAAVISRAGIPARLAVGWVGLDGAAVPGLHAWVEYRGGDGVWRVVDASRGASSSSPAVGDTSPADGLGVAVSETVEPAAAGVGGGHDRSGGLSRRSIVGLMVALVLVIGAVVVMMRRRVRVSRSHPEGEVDLPGLLRGALARPGAYNEVPALFARRVVPTLGDGAISLRRARSMASGNRLTVTAGGSELAQRVADSGLDVIDGSRPEGEAVASVLGAVDLDRWGEHMTSGSSHPVGSRLERAAESVGESWRVMVSRGTPSEVAVLDGRLAGLGRGHRVVVIDRDSGLWSTVHDLEGRQPAAAALLVAERVLDGIDGSPQWKHRVLRGLAVDAIHERAERAP